jgi:hypothetical protein
MHELDQLADLQHSLPEIKQDMSIFIFILTSVLSQLNDWALGETIVEKTNFVWGLLSLVISLTDQAGPCVLNLMSDSVTYLLCP